MTPLSLPCRRDCHWARHMVFHVLVEASFGRKATGAWRQQGLGCQGILQAATCHLPTRNPALPSCPTPQPCLIKWNLVGTAGTSATWGKHPSQTKALLWQEDLAPGYSLVTALLAQAFMHLRGATHPVTEGPPISSGDSLP